MRTPISRVRSATTYDSTPYSPTAPRSSASAEHDAERQHRERQLDHRPLRQELHRELAVDRRFGRDLAHQLAHLALQPVARATT